MRFSGGRTILPFPHGVLVNLADFPAMNREAEGNEGERRARALIGQMVMQSANVWTNRKLEVESGDVGGCRMQEIE